MVTGFATRNKKYCWWFLFSQTLNDNFHKTKITIMTNLIRMHWKYWILRSCYRYDHNKAILIHIDRNRQKLQIISPIPISGWDTIQWAHGGFMGCSYFILPYLIARLWVPHCNTIYLTEYAKKAKTQKQTVVCVWTWISNMKNTLNK